MQVVVRSQENGQNWRGLVAVSKKEGVSHEDRSSSHGTARRRCSLTLNRFPLLDRVKHRRTGCMRTSLIHSAGRCSARSAWTRASAGLAVVGGTAYCLSTRRNIFLDTAAGEPKQQRSLIKKVSEARISLRDSDREVWQGGQSVEVDTVSGIRRYDVATIARYAHTIYCTSVRFQPLPVTIQAKITMRRVSSL